MPLLICENSFGPQPAHTTPNEKTFTWFYSQEMPGYFPNKKNIWDVFEKPSGGTFTTTETYNTTYGPFAIQYYKSSAP